MAFRSFAALLTLLSLGTITVAADGASGASPATAIPVDNQAHTIQPNNAIWFRFDYDATDRPVTNIVLLDGNKSGLRFEVRAPETLANMRESEPIARSAAPVIACENDPAGQAGCKSKDIVSAGVFGNSGMYFVRVINDTPIPASAFLRIDIGGVTQNIANPPPPILVAAPSILTNADDPGRSVEIDNNEHILAAGSAFWFRFDYDAGDRPQKVVTLLYGNHSGVRFQVWTPDRLGAWWENKPVGQGTVYMVDCETHEESETGECESDDLKWAGRFIITWTVYVRVINDNGYPSPFVLTLQ